MLARALAGLWLVATLTPVAHAQSIDEIVVTATRRPTSAASVPAAVSVVDGDAVSGALLVTDALALQPGVFLQQTTPGQGAAIIRGQRGSSVLHLVDGMRLNNAIFRSAPTQYVALVPVTAVERIEVLRGTPASLYGTDAVGGVVQIVTRVPQFDGDEPELRMQVAASADTAELARSVRATLDAGTARLAASISGEYLETGDRRIGGGERIGPSGYRSKAGRVLLVGHPDEALSWRLDAQYLEQPETPRIDELVAGFGQDAPSSSEFSFTPNRRAFLHAGLDHAGGGLGLDWTYDLAWQRIDDDRRTRAFDSTERQFERNASDLFGATVSAGREEANGSWLVGAEYYLDRVSSSRVAVPLDGSASAVLAPRFPDGSELRQAGVYGNLTRRIGDRHTLSAGVRVSAVEVDLAATAETDAARVDVTDIGADIGWVADLSDSWQLAVNAGRGFRAPNVFDLGTLGARPGNRFNVPNARLGSERVRQVDVGVRFRRGGSRASLTAYRLAYDDRITSVLTGEVTSDGREVVQSVNAASATVYGIEFGAALALTESTQAVVVVNYARGEERGVGAGTEPADRIPPLNGRVGIIAALRPDVRLQAWLNGADDQHRLSTRDIGDVRIDPSGTPGWGTVDVAADFLDLSDWRVTVGVDNLFDRRYRVHGSGLDAPGRNLHITLRREF